MKLSFAIRLILGLAFIVSGALKLLPLTYFELLLEYQGLASMTFAPYLARIVIVLELSVGCAFLFGFGRGNWLALLYLGLLLVFSFQLVLQLSLDGNANSCGCFGTWFSVSPFASLVKNIVLALLLFIALRFGKEQKSERILYFLIFLTVGIALFISFPIQSKTVENNSSEVIKTLDVKFIDDLFEGVDLKRGDYIITALSTECSQCFERGLELNLLSRNNEDFPVIYNVLVGPNKEKFLMSIQASGQDYVELTTDDLYSKLKVGTPQFWLLRDGKVIGSWSRTSFSRNSVLKALVE